MQGCVSCDHCVCVKVGHEVQKCIPTYNSFSHARKYISIQTHLMHFLFFLRIVQYMQTVLEQISFALEVIISLF